MADYINTIDALGDEAVIDGIIDRTITEFKDNVLTKVGQSAFYNCAQLTEVDLPKVTTLPVSAFENCTSLTRIDFPNVRTVSGTTFKNCSSVTEVNLPLLENKSDFNAYYTFQGCKSVKRMVLPKLKTVWTAMCNGCTSLQYIDLPMVTSISSNKGWYNPFDGCGALKTIVLRSETLVTISSTYLHGTAYIYVPRALIEDYKVATNWSTFADQFRALEDYTVDGTTIGEFDESKI